MSGMSWTAAEREAAANAVWSDPNDVLTDGILDALAPFVAERVRREAATTDLVLDQRDAALAEIQRLRAVAARVEAIAATKPGATGRALRAALAGDPDE